MAHASLRTFCARFSADAVYGSLADHIEQIVHDKDAVRVA
jgi:hypothetical protein